MGRLTQRAVDSAKTPEKGQFFLRDGEIRGFALRITPNGARSFVWDGRIRGRMARITIGRYPALSLDEARARAMGIRHDIAIGLDPRSMLRKEKRQPRVCDLADLYVEQHARPRKSLGVKMRGFCARTSTQSLRSKPRSVRAKPSPSGINALVLIMDAIRPTGAWRFFRRSTDGRFVWGIGMVRIRQERYAGFGKSLDHGFSAPANWPESTKRLRTKPRDTGEHTSGFLFSWEPVARNCSERDGRTSISQMPSGRSPRPNRGGYIGFLFQRRQ